MRHAAQPMLAAILFCPVLLAAQAKPTAAIPATAPTQSVSDLPSAQPNTAAPAGNSESRVTWNGSQLTIEANGEPMPELLGRVAHETGMKITGGVPDERVFGKYGPASVQVVLAKLFDGLSINMMLVNASETQPKELMLTTRSGAPTPPSTRQVANDYTPRRRPESLRPILPPQQQRNYGQPPPASAPAGQSAFPPLAAPPAENTSFTNNGNTGSTTTDGTSTTSTTPADSSSQPQSPNGVRTPEQIFEELRKRQQSQSQ